MLIKVPFFGDRGAGSSIFSDRGAGSSIFGDRGPGRHRETGRTHRRNRWRGFWETTVQVSSSNERKVSQVLFRVVNRRPDDECQRACGIYGCAD